MPGGLDEPFLGPEPSTTTVTLNNKIDQTKRKLLIGAALCFAFMLIEIVGGIVAHSLAIITDAAHMLSDIAGFLVGAMSLFLVASRRPTARYTFGYHRAEVLGAIVSILIVWLMTGILLYQAVQRLFYPEVVDGRIMFWISLAGIFMNGVLMLVLGHDHGHGGGSCGHGHSHSHGHSEKKSHGHEHGHGGGGGGGHGHGHEHGHGGGGGGHGHDEELACCDEERTYQPPAHEHGHGSGGGGHAHEHGHGGGGGGGHGHGAPKKKQESSVALRAAMIHVIGDIIQSVGVCVAAALIWAFSDRWLDPQGISYWYRADPVRRARPTRAHPAASRPPAHTRRKPRPLVGGRCAPSSSPSW